MPSYESASAAIDRVNAEDPKGYEVLYGRRMVEWARRLAPGASEELLLAVRAQHSGRWKVPRAHYPEGRTGYLRWREGLKKRHADQLGAIMKDAGYAEASVAKARDLILLKNSSRDPEGQTLEDAACLVFLQFEFAEFAAKTAPEKVVDIVEKTWEKMSARAQEEALKLPYGAREQALLQQAFGGDA
jgi:hypothetical protein